MKCIKGQSDWISYICPRSTRRVTTVRIEYNPSTNQHDLAEPVRFYNEYQKSLGRPRRSVNLSDHKLLLKADAPGFVSLGVRLLDVGLGRVRLWTFEEIQEWGTGNWQGDLEPGCPPLTFVREGLPLELPHGFVFEPPPFSRGSQPTSEPPLVLSIEIEGTLGDSYSLFVNANANALVSLAKQIFFLSQPNVPISEGFTYDQSPQGDPRILTMRIERASFPENVPWAKVGRLQFKGQAESGVSVPSK